MREEYKGTILCPSRKRGKPDAADEVTGTQVVGTRTWPQREGENGREKRGELIMAAATKKKTSENKTETQ